MRYKVTAWHGEGRSVFCVVDSFAPESEQPAVVGEWKSKEMADSQARTCNFYEDMPANRKSFLARM